MELRDKYIRKSLQRLGDNPRDHDGTFHGLTEGYADVSGVKPGMDFSDARANTSPHQPWKIYPKPPSPHWHFGAKKQAVNLDGRVNDEDEFEFGKCDIPGSHEWTFELDDKGVYQVYLADGGSYSSRLVLIPNRAIQNGLHFSIFRPFVNTLLTSTSYFRSFLTALQKVLHIAGLNTFRANLRCSACSMNLRNW